MPQHEIAKLLPRHHRIIELLLDGHNHKTIAGIVGVTPQTISLLSKAPVVQQRLAERRQARERAADVDAGTAITRAKTILENGAETAANRVVDLVTNGVDHRVQLSAANNVLEQVFGSDKQRGSGNIVVNTEQLQVLQVALREAGAVDE